MAFFKQARQVRSSVAAVETVVNDRKDDLVTPTPGGVFDGTTPIVEVARKAGNARDRTLLAGLVAIAPTVEIAPGRRGFNTLITPTVTAKLPEDTTVTLSYDSVERYVAGRNTRFAEPRWEVTPPDARIPEEVFAAMGAIGTAAGAGTWDTYIHESQRTQLGMWGDVTEGPYAAPGNL